MQSLDGIAIQLRNIKAATFENPTIGASAKKIPNSFAIRQSESSTEISGNSPSLKGVRKVGALLNESAQADAAGHGRPAEGIPAIDGGEDVNRISVIPEASVLCIMNLAPLIQRFFLHFGEMGSRWDGLAG